jgi:regulator of cell morphogenesis and NO signaling
MLPITEQNDSCTLPQSEARTVRDYVVDDYRTAAVFQKYGLDFCCGGGVPIDRACQKKEISLPQLLADIADATATPTQSDSRYSSWSPAFLTNYIVVNHHAWVRSVTPTILEHTAKVARVHGGGNPALVMVDALFNDLAMRLFAHMNQEEDVLFPAIVAAEDGNDTDIASVVAAMEDDHSEAGEILRRIRSLTDDFIPPPEACMTYRVLFHELEEFERDLHRHVHLENNILFPKVMAS